MAADQLITVQLGSYANFVGSHYWNIQVWSACLSIAMAACQGGLLSSLLLLLLLLGRAARVWRGARVEHARPHSQL